MLILFLGHILAFMVSFVTSIPSPGTQRSLGPNTQLAHRALPARRIADTPRRLIQNADPLGLVGDLQRQPISHGSAEPHHGKRVELFRPAGDSCAVEGESRQAEEIQEEQNRYNGDAHVTDAGLLRVLTHVGVDHQLAACYARVVHHPDLVGDEGGSFQGIYDSRAIGVPDGVVVGRLSISRSIVVQEHPEVFGRQIGSINSRDVNCLGHGGCLELQARVQERKFVGQIRVVVFHRPSQLEKGYSRYTFALGFQVDFPACFSVGCQVIDHIEE